MNLGTRTAEEWLTLTLEGCFIASMGDKDCEGFKNITSAIQRDSFAAGVAHGARQMDYYLTTGLDKESTFKRIEQEAQSIKNEK